jgi:translation initiation factor 2B subunit (eIF-2B alpha/beta/delta family)
MSQQDNQRIDAAQRGLDAKTIAQIREIASDRISGAAELGLRAAELLSVTPIEDIPETARAIVSAQPTMASVYNAAQAALVGQLEDFVARLRHSGEVIARKAAGRIRDKVVLTHSFSSTVVRALQEGFPRGILCTESLPGGEGSRTAEVLHGKVIPDAAVYSVLPDVDVVLVGADAVTPDAVVNKVGTALVALAARARGKHAWVLCGVDKFVSSEWRPEFGGLFEATPRAWFTGVIDDSE